MPQKIKDKFANIPFIKNLAEKFDTFVWYSKIPKENDSEQFLTIAKISWADYSKSAAESRIAYAASNISEDDSLNALIKNIENKKFL